MSAVDAAHVELGGAARSIHDEHTQALLGGEAGGGGVADRRDDDRLEECRRQLLGRRFVEGSVERDDAAERRLRVALVGAAVGVGDVAADRETARVGVLDDGGRRLLEVAHQAAGGVAVEPVGEAQCRSLDLACVGEATGRAGQGVERTLLVGILAVAQCGDHRPAGGVLGRHRLLSVRQARQVVGHRCVVGGGVREGACRETVASRLQRWRRARAARPATSPYCAGSTSTATDTLFLAAARIIVGPPMSIFSMAAA